MTYALMIWTIVACGAYSCERDWRQVMTFEGNPGAKIIFQATCLLRSEQRYSGTL